MNSHYVDNMNKHNADKLLNSEVELTDMLEKMCPMKQILLKGVPCEVF